ncbi:MAG TPA: hypothetical protein PKY82_01245 [Pyrinomonadaceae bacterium]|nr:hypothetical protein [Pyrinomonadaceae bacterium]
MQTLQAGSFLHLENDGSLESLKFTARCLAEHTGSVVKENLNAQSLENLANNLWQKAEYVTRETERRRLQQIFVENFTERFHELKPDVSVSTADLIIQSFNSETVVTDKITAEENSPQPEQVSESLEKSDEFLGIVKTDSSFGEPAPGETVVSTMTSEVTAQAIVQSEPGTNSDSIKAENQTIAVETPISEISQLPEKAETTEQKIETVKPSASIATAPSQNAPTANQVNTVTKTENAKEPFEFGKCTVNLNLVLLAGSGSDNRRKVIVSAVSHNLPPEIEFLEINDGEDLEQIAKLVKDKLERFRQTLPVKYIEQLRAAKNKTAKTASPTPKQRETSAAIAEKTSDEQQPQSSNAAANNNIGQAGATEKASETVISAPAEVVSQPVAVTNNVQLSLF